LYRTAPNGGFDNEPAAPSVPPNEQSEKVENDQAQLNSVDISFSTATAVCEALKQALATQTAQLASLQDQLSSADAAKETGARLLSMLRNRMEAQMSETQKARGELWRAKNDLIVMRFERNETETSFQALQAEVADVKLQNSRLTSDNKRLETEMAQMAEEYVRIIDALGGSSSTTFQQFHKSPANAPYIEDSNWDTLTHGHTDPPNQHEGDFELAALMQLGFDEEGLCEQQEELLKDIRCLFECGVCMDEQPEDYVTLLDPCGHKFCRDCIRNHVGAKLAERYFPILCPVCMAEEGKSDPGSE